MELRWRIDYLADARIVRATTSGTVTREGALTVAADLVKELEATGAVKFLVDHRSAVMRIGIADLYYLLSETEQIGLTRRYTGAIVFAEDTDHDFRFYQFRASNAGFERRTFTDMAAALEWLSARPG
jgi:hypothetical protein